MIAGTSRIHITLERIVNCRAKLTVFLGLVLMAGSALAQPTKLSVPHGAKDVHEVDLFNGGAHETYFTMDVAYPSNPALEHYKAIISQPWLRCSWIPVWESYIDGTTNPPRRVYQQATVWINRGARKTLMVSSRYTAPKGSGEKPDNDHQQVVVVEYMHQDVDKIISSLKLQCPDPAMRSNTTPQSDARDAPRVAWLRQARAGGRER